MAVFFCLGNHRRPGDVVGFAVDLTEEIEKILFANAGVLLQRFPAIVGIRLTDFSSIAELIAKRVKELA